jgi:hypothetical protein
MVMYARQVDPASSGFRFWRDLDNDGRSDANEIGLVGSGNAPDIDFSIERDAAGDLFLTPVRPGTGVIAYGSVPAEDLTSIDYAPDVTYPSTGLSAEPGWGYVFEMDGGDSFVRYGAVRVTHVGLDYLILDWAFQTDPGNPELIRAR